MNNFFRNLKNQLGQRAYRIARLYWVHEWSTRRIARKIGINQSNVVRHLVKARQIAQSLTLSMDIDLVSFQISCA